MSHLSEAIAPWLRTPAMIAYRHSYRSFRQGESRGAEGDASDVGISVIKNLKNNDRTDIPSSVEVLWPDWLNDTLEDRHDHPIRMVTRWRLAYHRFRRGDPEGAEGELERFSELLTKDSLEFLPVWQLIKFHRSQLASATADAATLTSPYNAIHVHFGCGKLCLGLVLKCLAGSSSRKPFLLVQSPRSPWDLVARAKGGTVRVSVNDGEFVTELFVHSSTDDIELLNEQIAAARDGKGPLGGLLLVPRSGVVPVKDYVLGLADTLSCSVGPGMKDLGTLLSESLGEKTKDEVCPVLFACENDHAGVATMAAMLTSKCHVATCMVDRICSGLEILQDENDRVNVIVKTESYPGEIVVKNLRTLSMNRLRSIVPFQDPCVRIPSLDAQANYFAERKFLLVNGGHTTLAFLTMLRANGTGLSFTPPGEFELLNWDTMSSDEKGSFWAFSLARILLLLWQYDSEVLMDAHGVSSDTELVDILMKYAADTLRRFSAVPDTTKRILAGGVDNRFEGRLKNVEEFLNAANPAQHPVGKKLLDKAQVGFCEMAGEVHALVSRSFRFTANGQSSSKMCFPIPELASSLIDQHSPATRASEAELI